MRYLPRPLCRLKHTPKNLSVVNNTNADFQIFLFYDINDTYFYTLTFSMKKFKIKKKKTLLFGFPRMILNQSAIFISKLLILT